MRRAWSSILAAVLAALACAACSGEIPCIDEDLDGLGSGCSAGPDCDDENAARGEDCDAVPPPDCAADPKATGCPCLPGSVSECYGGPSGTAGVGVCSTGRTRCVGSHWGACAGGVVPDDERCDDRDEDCDGIADEGVRSPCGGCDTRCEGDVWGDPFVDPPNDGFEVTSNGWLTLARTPVESATVWVPNTAEGTVSRIDAESATETARYATGDRNGFGLEPARVAIDWNGNAWIANRAFDGTSSVVMIAGERARCEDQDGDGSITTSTGPADVLAWPDDECVLASVDVGGEREVARAIAIDGDRGLDGVSGGDAWIGLHDGHAFVEIDGLSGEVLQRVETPGFMPYSAAFDPWGVLWAIERDGRLARIDPSTDPPDVRILEVPLACWLLYGLAIDREGRIAASGFSCDRVTVYDPTLDRWESVTTDPSGRGATFVGRELWIAHTGATLTRMALDPLRVLSTHALASEGVRPIETIGLSADTLGHLWAASTDGGSGGGGVVTRVDLPGVTPSAQVSIGLAPHVQGDMTGQQLGEEFVPEATATHVFGGCVEVERTEWIAVHLMGDSGTNGSLEIELRHAASVEALADASWSSIGTWPGATSPLALDLPMGGFVELRVTMQVDGRLGAPRIRRIGVEGRCPGPM